jgi:hypothetical protein
LAFLGAATVLLAAGSGGVPAPTAHAQGVVEQTVEYSCLGRPEPFSVPPGVTQLTIEAEGAAGANSSGMAGRGGTVRGTLPVTPGDLLTIEVGYRNGYGHIPGGAGGSSASESGGHGDGATGIRNAFEVVRVPGLLLVAAGGGGGGGGGRNFVNPMVTQTATATNVATSLIVIYPLWGVTACSTPDASRTGRCYNPATTSAYGPSR